MERVERPRESLDRGGRARGVAGLAEATKRAWGEAVVGGGSGATEKPIAEVGIRRPKYLLHQSGLCERAMKSPQIGAFCRPLPQPTRVVPPQIGTDPSAGAPAAFPRPPNND